MPKSILPAMCRSRFRSIECRRDFERIEFEPAGRIWNTVPSVPPAHVVIPGQVVTIA
jgi:hypothetical protein